MFFVILCEILIRHTVMKTARLPDAIVLPVF